MVAAWIASACWVMGAQSVGAELVVGLMAMCRSAMRARVGVTLRSSTSRCHVASSRVAWSRWCSRRLAWWHQTARPAAPGGYGSEYVEVELGGMVGESQHPFGTGVIESGVELADVETECVPLRLRWRRVRSPGSSGVRSRSARCCRAVFSFPWVSARSRRAACTSLVHCPMAVLSRRGQRRASLLVEGGLAARRVVVRRRIWPWCAVRRVVRALFSVSAEVGREGGFDGGELVGEVLAADAQRFDAVGEGLVGADAGEGDVGPVLVEPCPRRRRWRRAAIRGRVHGDRGRPALE